MRQRVVPHGRAPVTRQPRSFLPRLLAVLGVLALVVCAALLALVLPGAERRHDAFAHAAPCPSNVQQAADCLTTRRLNVESTHVHTGSGTYEADLYSLATGDLDVDFDGPGPLLETLGGTGYVTQVYGTIWRGEVVRISSLDGATSQDTSASPDDHPTGIVVSAAIAGAVGLVLPAARWVVTRPHRRGAVPGPGG